MIEIKLEGVSNGVVKRIKDTQFNSADHSSEFVKVYEIHEEDDQIESFIDIIDLLSDISEDLGLNLGSDFSQNQIKFIIDWGDKYIPSMPEIDNKIKDYQSTIKDLKNLKNTIKEKDDNNL